MRTSPAQRVLFYLTTACLWLAACGDDDDEAPRDAGADSAVSQGGTGGVAAGSGGRGGGGAGGVLGHCDSRPRPLSDFCGSSSPCSTLDELRAGRCMQICPPPDGCSDRRYIQVLVGSNDCGGVSVTDRTTPTARNYHFDASGALVGAAVISDDCYPPRGAFYGMRCSVSDFEPIDCKATGATGDDAGADAG